MHRALLERNCELKTQRQFGPRWYIERIVMDDGNEALQVMTWLRGLTADQPAWQTDVVIPGFGSFTFRTTHATGERGPDKQVSSLIEAAAKSKEHVAA